MAGRFGDQKARADLKAFDKITNGVEDSVRTRDEMPHNSDRFQRMCEKAAL